MLFALGMCMALISEWNAFKGGIVLGILGIVLGVITVLVWRKMENKPPIKISGKTILTIIVAIIGISAFGIGMCFCMIWDNMILGIIIGFTGIVVLLSLIPITKGLQ
ncbi:MAG: hypothetical protein ACI4GY_03670 [Acutalibacteraceae bacterium]